MHLAEQAAAIHTETGHRPGLARAEELRRAAGQLRVR
jgi:hypothetical protein